MRRKIIIYLIVLGVIILAGVGFWAYSTGKFAGLADVVRTSSKGQIKILAKNASSNNAPMTGVNVEKSTDGLNFSSVGSTGAEGYLTYSVTESQGQTLHFRVSHTNYTASPTSQQVSLIEFPIDRTLEFRLTFTGLPSGKGAITGKVTSNNKPLAQAQVSLYTTANVATGNNANTNTEGIYILNNLNPGTYNIAASKEGYKENKKTNIVVKADQVTPIDFSLQLIISPSPSGSTSASPTITPDPNKFTYYAEVSDSSGTILDGVVVELKPIPQFSSVISWRGDTQGSPVDTTKYGQANLVIKDIAWPSSCATQKYQAIFRKDSYGEKSLDFNCSDITLDTNLNSYVYHPSEKIILSQVITSLSGTVTDNDTNKPIGNVIITLLKYDEIKKIWFQFPDPVKTDSQGKYSFTSMKPGTYRIFAYHEQYYNEQNPGSSILEFEIKIGETKIEDFKLKKLKKIYYYDLNLTLLDDKGARLDIPNSIEKKDIEIQVKDDRPDFFDNIYDFELIQQDGKWVVHISDIPCGRPEELILKIKRDFIENGKKYKLQKTEDIKYNCNSDPNQTFSRDIRLERMILDPTKVTVRGNTYWPDNCGHGFRGPFYLDPTLGNLEVELVSVSTNTVSQKTIVDYSFGRFVFENNVAPGTYYLRIADNSNFSGKSENFTVGNQDVSKNILLNPKPAYKQQYTSHLSINGVDIYFIGSKSQEAKNSIDWQAITKAISGVVQVLKPDLVPNPRTLPIYVIDMRLIPGASGGALQGCPPMTAPGQSETSKSFVLLPEALLRTSDPQALILHEYGHYLYYSIANNSAGNKFITGWNSYFREQALPGNPNKECIFRILKDTNIGLIFEKFGHPSSDANETFASFISAYYEYHMRFRTIISSFPEGSECGYALKYFWNLFAREITASPDLVENTSSVQSTSIMLCPDDDDIFGPVIAGFDDTIFTPDQINNGYWLQSVYDTLGPLKKVNIAYTKAISKIYNLFNTSPDQLGNQIQLALTEFTSFFDKLFPGGNRGNIEGMMVDNVDSPQSNIIITIDGRMAVTGSDGKYSIVGSKTGEQKIKAVDGKTYRSLKVTPDAITIVKDKTINWQLEIH